MRVLGAIDLAPGKSERARIKAVAEMSFLDEHGDTHRFTWRTISTWLVRYRKHGLTVLHNKTRSDKGTIRKVSPEAVLEAIQAVKPSFHNRSYTLASLYRACIERGLLLREKVAPNTFRRIVREYEMLKPDSESNSKPRLAFAKQFANQMWQADTLVGPYLEIKGTPVQARLIAFIDDASRVVTHGEFFLADNVDTLITGFKTALYKRGVPEILYVDNGANYSSKELLQVCERLGCLLNHTPVRDGAAKGKIERFFLTVRQKFLCLKLDLSSLAALNREFIQWLEDDYNSQPHSALGMRPIDRFGLDLNRIRYLPPSEITDEFFYLEEDRHVKADNTFSLKTVRFEAPADFRNRKIQVRFDRFNFTRVVVYYKTQRCGVARPLNLLDNDRPPSPPDEDQPPTAPVLIP